MCGKAFVYRDLHKFEKVTVFCCNNEKTVVYGRQGYISEENSRFLKKKLDFV